jgi:hypothetical protein
MGRASRAAGLGAGFGLFPPGNISRQSAETTPRYESSNGSPVQNWLTLVSLSRMPPDAAGQRRGRAALAGQIKTGASMVDKTGLQTIGWLFGGMTAAVMLIAALLVSQASAPALRGITSDFSSSTR